MLIHSMAGVCGIYILHVSITSIIFSNQLANIVSLAYQGDYVIVICLSFTVKVISILKQVLLIRTCLIMLEEKMVIYNYSQQYSTCEEKIRKQNQSENFNKKEIDSSFSPLIYTIKEYYHWKGLWANLIQPTLGPCLWSFKFFLEHFVTKMESLNLFFFYVIWIVMIL